MDSPFCNYTKAILLLGRFHDVQSLPMLESICADGGASAAAIMSCENGCPSRAVYAKEFAAYANVAVRKIKGVIE